MNNIIDKSYAEKVPDHAIEIKEHKPVFFINFHGVYNERKRKNMMRVVFNSSEQYPSTVIYFKDQI